MSVIVRALVGTRPGGSGCHTQGRTIARSRERIREALSLFVEHADSATLVDNVKMPGKVRQAVNRYTAARKRAEAVSSEAATTAREAVQALAGEGLELSRWDAAEGLGISHQRVQQLMEG